MARGRPSKWVRVEILQPFWITKKGISIRVWDKYGRKHLGDTAFNREIWRADLVVGQLDRVHPTLTRVDFAGRGSTPRLVCV